MYKISGKFIIYRKLNEYALAHVLFIILYFKERGKSSIAFWYID